MHAEHARELREGDRRRGTSDRHARALNEGQRAGLKTLQQET